MDCNLFQDRIERTQLELGCAKKWSCETNFVEMFINFVNRTQFSPLTSGWKNDLKNHGNPKHSNISNVFELIELLMPIAPCPWFVTITLEMASGKLVPAAKNVNPITESGMFIVSPVCICMQMANNVVQQDKKKTISSQIHFISMDYNLSIKCYNTLVITCLMCI